MGKVALRGLVLVAIIALLGVGSYAIAGGGARSFKGDLEGYQENLDVSTVATGSFKARLSDDGTKLEYELSYSGLEGNVLFAHIHFGKAGVNGGVSYFLCGGVDQARSPCPQSGTVTGEIVAADVIGPTGQGIEAGNFAEILAAMRAGHAYANVHSSKWPGGEIRAQLNDRGRS